MHLIAMERQFNKLILATAQLLVSAFQSRIPGASIISSTLRSEKISGLMGGRS